MNGTFQCTKTAVVVIDVQTQLGKHKRVLAVFDLNVQRQVAITDATHTLKT